MNGRAWIGVGNGADRGTHNDLSGRADFVVQAGSVGGDVHLHVSDPASSVPAARHLPPAAGGFIDRVHELKALDGATAPPASESGAGAPLLAVTGGPGVGKTALVVNWARRQNGRYPDGELYADLGGHESGSPASPAEILDGFLRALNVPAPSIPVDIEGRATMFRSLVAKRKMLIVLDNAVAAAQVWPLLAGSPVCAVVVTSRSRLAGPVARDGATRVGMDELPPMRQSHCSPRSSARSECS